MRPARVLLPILFLAVASIVAWYWLSPPRVTIAHPTRGPAVDAVYATGLVEPTLEIRIAPRTAGRLIELRADEGDLVEKGQLLARLEDEDLRASVAELEARVDYARMQYERNLELQRKNLIAQDTLDRTRSDLEATRAALKRARDQMRFMQLIAPTRGRIIRRDGEVGDFIPVNQTVFYMAGPAPLRVSAEIDEEDVPRVKPGLPVLIRADAFPDRTFEGTVDQITPRGDPVARSFRVRVALADKPPLQIGMTAETNIIVSKTENALLVPSSALVNGYVWVVTGNRTEQRAVTVGIAGPERTEIRGGLEESDWIITHPTDRLSPGSRVRVVDAEEKTAPAP
jgi:RND family efflux transporter MFP subunit